MVIGTPDWVAPVGPPPNAAGNEPPIATLRIMKNPWWVALFQVVASTWLALTVKKLLPSRYQRICSGLVLRSSSIAYVWKPVWHPPQARSPLPRPVYSLQGPPGATPQCSVANSELRPLMSSMTSISPMPGQPVAPVPRAAAPSDQKAGQYPAAAAPLTLGCCKDASRRSLPPAGAAKSVRCVSTRPLVQLPAPSRSGLMTRWPPPSRKTFCVLFVMFSISPVPQFAAPPG